MSAAALSDLFIRLDQADLSWLTAEELWALIKVADADPSYDGAQKPAIDTPARGAGVPRRVVEQ